MNTKVALDKEIEQLKSLTLVYVEDLAMFSKRIDDLIEMAESQGWLSQYEVALNELLDRIDDFIRDNRPVHRPEIQNLA